jgi:hypothetical protein
MMRNTGPSGPCFLAAPLRSAREALQAGAARITDTGQREGFLHNLPHPREIIPAWGASTALAARALR